jgi:hypothetical protein
MEKHYTIINEYQALTNEWNSVAIVNAIFFSVSILGIILGLLNNHMPVVGLATVLMLVFAAFEYRTRKRYVNLKTELEEEMYKLAGMKKPKREEMIRHGLWY